MMPLDHQRLILPVLPAPQGHGQGRIRCGRAVSLLGALAVHGLVVLAVLCWPSARPAPHREDRVTLFALSLPAEPAGERPAPEIGGSRRTGPAKAAPSSLAVTPRQSGEAAVSVLPGPPAPVPAAILSAAPLPAPTMRPVETVAERPARQLETSGLLADYQKILWERIAAHRPRGLHMVGTARIRFRLDRKGDLLSAEVARSSGLLLLDRAALRTVRQASPFPAPAREIDDGALDFEVPIEFR